MLLLLTAMGNSLMFRSLALGEVLLTTLLWIYVNFVMLEEMVLMTHLSRVLCSITKMTLKVIVKGLYALGAW